MNHLQNMYPETSAELAGLKIIYPWLLYLYVQPYESFLVFRGQLGTRCPVPRKKSCSRRPNFWVDNYINCKLFSKLSPDVGNCNLEAGFPVQLFYFNQTLRYPEIAVALQSTFLGILRVFDGNLLKMPNLSTRHSIIPEPW